MDKQKLKYLVCVSDDEHSYVAFKYSCAKAARVGAVVEVLTITDNIDMGLSSQAFLGLSETLKEEAHARAQEILRKCTDIASAWPNVTISCAVREGYLVDVISRVIDENNDIILLIFGSNTSTGNNVLPAILSKLGSKILIPIMVIPGNLTDQQIAELVS